MTAKQSYRSDPKRLTPQFFTDGVCEQIGAAGSKESVKLEFSCADRKFEPF